MLTGGRFSMHGDTFTTRVTCSAEFIDHAGPTRGLWPRRQTQAFCVGMTDRWLRRTFPNAYGTVLIGDLFENRVAIRIPDAMRDDLNSAGLHVLVD
jgi:hypothetical protein